MSGVKGAIKVSRRRQHTRHHMVTLLVGRADRAMGRHSLASQFAALMKPCPDRSGSSAILISSADRESANRESRRSMLTSSLHNQQRRSRSLHLVSREAIDKEWERMEATRFAISLAYNVYKSLPRRAAFPTPPPPSPPSDPHPAPCALHYRAARTRDLARANGRGIHTMRCFFSSPPSPLPPPSAGPPLSSRAIRETFCGINIRLHLNIGERMSSCVQQYRPRFKRHRSAVAEICSPFSVQVSSRQRRENITRATRSIHVFTIVNSTPARRSRDKSPSVKAAVRDRDKTAAS